MITLRLMTLKQKIFEQCIETVNSKISVLQQSLADLKESGTNETKSTAGDKHETALAMLQIEQAKTRAQLQEALAQFAILKNINPAIVATKITLGSVIVTGKGYFYISIALGKIVVDDITIYTLSQQSPLGAKLMGLNVGDSASVNGYDYLVEAIL